MGPGQRGRPRRRTRRGLPRPAGRPREAAASSKALGKQGFYAQVDLDQPKAYAYAIELMAASSQTPDAREGMLAFRNAVMPSRASGVWLEAAISSIA